MAPCDAKLDDLLKWRYLETLLQNNTSYDPNPKPVYYPIFNSNTEPYPRLNSDINKTKDISFFGVLFTMSTEANSLVIEMNASLRWTHRNIWYNPQDLVVLGQRKTKKEEKSCPLVNYWVCPHWGSNWKNWFCPSMWTQSVSNIERINHEFLCVSSGLFRSLQAVQHDFTSTRFTAKQLYVWMQQISSWPDKVRLGVCLALCLHLVSSNFSKT